MVIAKLKGENRKRHTKHVEESTRLYKKDRKKTAKLSKNVHGHLLGEIKRVKAESYTSGFPAMHTKAL
jgi:hypothetical protein